MQTRKFILRACSSEALKAPWHRSLHPVSSQPVTRLTLLINTHTVSSDDSNWWVQPPQDPHLFKGPWTHRREGRKENGDKQARILSVSGKLLSWTARLSSLLSAGSWLVVLLPQLLSRQVSHCLCLWPWQAAQVSHSGFSAPSGTSALVPSGSQSERQHSPITQHVSLPGGIPCGVYSLSIGPELKKLCQRSHDPPFTLNAN